MNLSRIILHLAELKHNYSIITLSVILGLSGRPTVAWTNEVISFIEFQIGPLIMTVSPGRRLSDPAAV